MYIFLYPLGFMLLLDAASKLASSNSLPLFCKVTTTTLLGFACILMPCYLLLHWHGVEYLSPLTTPPISHYLNTYLLSCQLLILWLPFGVVFLLLTYRLFANAKNNTRSTRPNLALQRGLC